jgi:hypothetical protein
VDYRGELAVESRVFTSPPPEVAQFPGASVSVMVDPTFSARTDDGLHQLTAEPFLRMDSHDRNRTHADVRQAEYQLQQGGLSVGAGVGRFHWGQLTGIRLVDVVNQLDLVEDLAGTEKLGQPYASVGLGGGPLHLVGMALPVHRQRTFPGLTGRMRPTNGVDTGDAQYETALGMWQPSFGARATLTAGPLELAASGFTGVSRDPRFLAQLTDPRVATAYDLLDQASADTALVLGPVVLKGEGAVKQYGVDDIFAWAAGGGAEVTAFGLGGSSADLTLIGEYARDVRPLGTPATVWDNDAFAGLRLALNDLSGTEVLGGALVDLDSGFTFARAAVQRRLDEHFKVEVQGSLFLGPSDTMEWWLLGEDHVQLSLQYHL